MSLANDADDGPITIRVWGLEGDMEEAMFKMKRSTEMVNLFDAYAVRKGDGLNSLRFLYNGERINFSYTPTDLELDDNGVIECASEQTGMISTFTSKNTSDTLIQYLMMTDDEWASADTMVPIESLRRKVQSTNVQPFATFDYQECPEILHRLQREILCELLELVWVDSSSWRAARVDTRSVLTNKMFEQILSSLDSILDHEYKSTNFNEKFGVLFGQVPDARTDQGCKYKIALRMTRGPTNACIDFHCDGLYATSTSQIPLNATSEYEGGSLVFFVNDHLHIVPRVPGSLGGATSSACIAWGNKCNAGDKNESIHCR